MGSQASFWRIILKMANTNVSDASTFPGRRRGWVRFYYYSEGMSGQKVLWPELQGRRRDRWVWGGLFSNKTTGINVEQLNELKRTTTELRTMKFVGKVFPCSGSECLWKTFHQETRFIRNLHATQRWASFPRLYLLGHHYTSTGTVWGTIVLDLQSGSCVHCQLFPHTHTTAPWPSRSPRESATSRKRQRLRKPTVVHASTR